MVRVAECPNCAQQLRVPDDLSETQVVRCPICDAEYPLAEIPLREQDASDEELPAEELVPVATVAPDDAASAAESTEDQDGALAGADAVDEEAGDTDEGDDGEKPVEAAGPSTEANDPEQEHPPAGEASGEADSQHLGAATVLDTEQSIESPEADHAAEPVAGEDEEDSEVASATVEQAEQGDTAAGAVAEKAEKADVELECPCCGEKFAFSEAILTDSGQKVGRERAQRVFATLTGGDPAEQATGFVPRGCESVQIDTGQSAPGVDEEAMQFAASLAQQQPQEESVTARIAPRGKPKSVVKELCSWVFGGLAGLIIAYYLLVIIRGDAGNFLRIPVLGIPHTYKYSPSWFPGFLRAEPDADSEDESAGEPSARLPRGPEQWIAEAMLARRCNGGSWSPPSGRL